MHALSLAYNLPLTSIGMPINWRSNETELETNYKHQVICLFFTNEIIYWLHHFRFDRAENVVSSIYLNGLLVYFSKFILRPNYKMHRQPQNHLNNFVYYFISSFQWHLRLIKNKIHKNVCTTASTDKSRPLFEVVRERWVSVGRSYGDRHTFRLAKWKSNDWVSLLSVTRTEKEKLTTANEKGWRLTYSILTTDR